MKFTGDLKYQRDLVYRSAVSISKIFRHRWWTLKANVL